MLKRILLPLALLLLAAVFLAAVEKLCVLRFQRGDVYPAYSSLRCDPLGAKVFYDAAGGVDGMAVQRNYQPLHKLDLQERRTLVYLGANLDRFTGDFDDLLQLAAMGSRVVIAFAPSAVDYDPKPKEDAKAKTSPAPDEKKDAKDSQKKNAKDAGSDDDFAETRKWVSWNEALQRLGIKVHHEQAWLGKKNEAKALFDGAEPALSWHGTAWLECSATAGKALYSCQEKPVIVEKKRGKGSVVLATDCYLFSNEAMRAERAPRLLAALAGGNSRIVFDEFHLGSAEEPGLATLIRQYRLEGVFLVFGFLGLLYLWRNAMPLVPRAARGPSQAPGGVVMGRHSAEGFVNLLRRSIPPSRVVGVCVEEWNAAFARRRGRVAAPESADPLSQFSQLASKLQKTKR